MILIAAKIVHQILGYPPVNAARRLMLMWLWELSGVNARQLMLMMLAASGENWGRLWSKHQAADAHDAGGFAGNWGGTVE